MVEKETKQYLTDAFSEIESYQKLINLGSVLKKPTMHLKDTGISSRNISHWKNSDLLNDKIEGSDGWHKFNFFEYIWLKTIQKMRTFGLPLSTIKKAKNVLFEKLDLKWNEESIKEMTETTINLVKSLGMSKDDTKNAIHLILNTDLKEKFKEEGYSVNVLNSLVINSLLKNQEVGVYIFDNGESLAWMDEFNRKAGVEKLIQKSHLYISIRSFINDFLNDATKEKIITYYKLLSEKELAVVRRIRDKDVDGLTIKFPKDKRENGIDIITKKNYELLKEDEDKIAAVSKVKNFESVSIKDSGNGKLFIEKIHRKKL